MKSWKLKNLVIISLVSIIGLIFIQAFWIRDAIKIREHNFRQNVNQAVARAVWRLERLAMVSVYKGNKDRSAEEKGSESNSDNSDYILDTVPLPSYMISTIDTTIANTSANLLQLETLFDSSGQRLLNDSGTPVGSLINSFSFKKIPKQVKSSPLDSIIDNIEKISDEVEAFHSVKLLIEDRINNITNSEYSDKKIELADSLLINELLSEELGNEGLNLKFTFSIYLPFSQEYLFCHSQEELAEVKKSKYIYALFPAFRLSKPLYLAVVFPDEVRYLFLKHSYILSISITLILILALSFYIITASSIRQKKLSEMKRDFINNMTHEFKTPVSTISLACEALQDTDVAKSPEIYDSYLKMINDENRKLGNFAEKILQTTVLEKGHFYFYFEPVDLHEVINLTMKGFLQAVNQQNGVIRTKFLATNPNIVGDKIQLQNVVSNLLDNAIKYSGSNIDIKILTQDNDNELFISIKDSGIGISKSEQKRIFDKLYRTSTGNLHDVKGYGLGLSFVKHIVEQHNGRIEVESELSKGSEFKIYLPRHRTAGKK